MPQATYQIQIIEPFLLLGHFEHAFGFREITSYLAMDLPKHFVAKDETKNVTCN